MNRQLVITATEETIKSLREIETLTENATSREIDWEYLMELRKSIDKTQTKLRYLKHEIRCS